MTPAAIAVGFDDPVLERSVRGGLDAVEAALRESVLTGDDFVSDVSRHLVDAGGKRFRPMVSVLAAHFGDPTRPEIVPAAVVCEITHLATLYHDDVMDEALVRRGAPSANARWTNTVAILTGDFLFSRASNILSDLGPFAVRLQARTFERLVIGQIRETVGARAGVDPLDHYLSVLADKTGSLIAAAAEFGAHFAGVDDEQIASLRLFGEQIGVAFQLSDDIIDVASESAESGKTPGTDLREGIATLPSLYALRSTDPASARLRELVSRPLPDDAEHGEALRLLRESAGMAEARATLQEHVDAARTTLTALPDVPARRALEALTELVIDRTG
ncbi:heptaprenyl diphosphate synthase [Jatrophihabitans endophyticus]|uniref:Heptaprenyl diphosphate synthase n=1 Tax=Jatrophihabitans endophyticus TaxID=1206085 RepID=A0A1M5GUW8_9ACTN|nr:polyprenyl synthetase family protein [Jatrophihabitans endophyticus]SHG07544.1 heptaprenyl diphosphate synthase [Jatrophihabitans endophyticus]